MRLTILLFAMACKPAEPTVAVLPTPAPAPVPTPVPTPPPPTPAPPLPADSTLLTSIPVTDWPWICDAFAQEQDAVNVSCEDFSLTLPARDAAGDAEACVQYFERVTTWPAGCQATFGDFRVMTNFIPTCDPFPEEVTTILECVDPPVPPPPPACPVILQTYPIVGSSTFLANGELTWSFTDVDLSATVSVVDAGGTLVPGTTGWNGDFLTFSPDAFLLPSSTYTWTVDWCNLSDTQSFTTSPVGATVPTGTLSSQTYFLDLASPQLSFVQPFGVGALLQSQIAGTGFLIEVVSASPTDLQLRMGTGFDSPSLAQDVCSPTSDIAVDFSGNPFFETGPTPLSLSVNGFSVPLDEVVLDGAFTPAGDALLLHLEASLDTRPLVDVFVQGGGPDAVCVLVAQFGVLCQPCATGGDFCLPLEIVGIVADEVPGLTVVERTIGDILLDPTCAP